MHCVLQNIVIYLYCQLPSLRASLYTYKRTQSIAALRMASGKELIDAVRSSLEADGELSQVKAEMRTKVMKLLEGSGKSSRSKHPKSPHEVLLINELIREYLDWMGYKYTSSVLVAECELSKQPLDRAFITKGLGTDDTEKSKDLPVLFSLVETFKELKEA